MEIPWGEVRPYSWVAREIGRPRAVRAVGSSLGHNPLPFVVPCHRVVRADGHIGEYGAGGPAAKRAMLATEGIDTGRPGGAGRRRRPVPGRRPRATSSATRPAVVHGTSTWTESSASGAGEDALLAGYQGRVPTAGRWRRACSRTDPQRGTSRHHRHDRRPPRERFWGQRGEPSTDQPRRAAPACGVPSSSSNSHASS